MAEVQVLDSLVQLIHDLDGINDKRELAKRVSEMFGTTQDRSVYSCADFAIRFSSSAGRNFGNTVLSLSNLRKYDDRPFIVCLVTPARNYCLLANSTFLKKISHSSQELKDVRPPTVLGGQADLHGRVGDLVRPAPIRDTQAKQAAPSAAKSRHARGSGAGEGKMVVSNAQRIDCGLEDKLRKIVRR